MKQINLKISDHKDIIKILKANVPLFFIIALIVFVTFVWSINGEFVSDDVPGIVRNAKIRDLNASIGSLDHWVIVRSLILNVFGLKPLPYHAASMIFHVLNVILFFIVIYNIFNKKIAAMASVLYSVHSVVAEAVIWISAFNYQLSTFYLYISIIIYLLYKKTKDRKYIFTLYAFFGFVSMTFPNYWVLIIPFIVAGLDFFVLERNYNFKTLLPIAPLFLLGLLSFFVISGESRVTERVARLNTETATPYINRIPFSIYNNAELLLYPRKLTIYHEGEALPDSRYKMMIAFSVILVGSIAALWFNKKTRLYGGMIILMFISILPVFSPVLVAWMVAERYLYFTAGIFTTLVVMLFLKLEKKLRIKNLAIILTVILLVAYSGRSIARAQEWKTRKSLWLSAERWGPYSARAHNNLGDVFGVEGDWERSIWHFRRAIELNPVYSEAYHNLGNTLMQLGYFDQAKALLNASLEINPELHQSMHKLGLIEYQQGNVEKAMEYFIRTLEIEPTYAPAIQSVQALRTLQQRNQ